jgi:hypothetical protein
MRGEVRLYLASDLLAKFSPGRIINLHVAMR